MVESKELNMAQGIIKEILEHPKADQNTLFHNYVINFSTTKSLSVLLANDLLL